MQLPSYELAGFGVRAIHVQLDQHPYQASIRLRVVIDCAFDRVREPDADVACGVWDALAYTVCEGVIAVELWERLSEAQRDSIVREQIRKALAHEVDEWLARDGKRLRDPHASETKQVDRS